MAKNSREPKGKRRATDGGVTALDVSPILTTGALGRPEGAKSSMPDFFDVLLVRVNLEVLDKLIVGTKVTFKGNERELIAYSASHRIGLVASKDRNKVLGAIAAGGRAWLRDIYDKGLAVRIEW